MTLLKRFGDSVKAPRLTLVGMALFVVLGCGEDPPSGATPPPEIDLDTQAQWSGGTVTAQSAAFRNLTRLPVIMVDAETLQVSRVDDYKLLVRLPQRPSGDVALVLHEGRLRDTLGVVRLYGFSSQKWFTPGFDYSVLAVGSRNGEPVVLGNGYTGGVVVFSPRTGIASRITGVRAPSGYYGIGYTHLSNRFVLRDSAGTLGIWELWPQPVRVGSWPVGSYNRHHAQLGPSVFLTGYSHQTYVTDTTSPARGYGPFDIEDSWMAALSPRGDRAVLASVASNEGVPVFNSLTGDTAYTLPSVRILTWAAFSPDGAVLHLAGRGVPDDSLRNVDATTGAQLASGLLLGAVATMTADPDGRFLYLALWADCGPSVAVYDARTLVLVGELPAPGPFPGITGSGCFNVSWEGQIVADRTQGKLWVVWNGEPAPYFEFDLLPSY